MLLLNSRLWAVAVATFCFFASRNDGDGNHVNSSNISHNNINIIMGINTTSQP